MTAAASKNIDRSGGRVGQRVRAQAAKRVPGALRRPLRYAVRVRRASSGRRAVLQAGAFDQEWYEAQTGTEFDSIEKACWHYLWLGRRAGFSPHPFFEPSVAAPKTFRSSAVDPLVASLRGNTVRGARVHPGLPESWAKRDRKKRLPRWLVWAKSASVDSRVPSLLTRPIGVPWEEFRAAAIDAAVECRHAQERRAAPVLTATAPQYAKPTRQRPVRVSTRSTDGPPTVSVVMPAWNRGGMIRKAIASVQAQTLVDWELIVVDDGSDDDTLLVLEGLAAFEPRLRVIAAAHAGVCRARNLGLEAAQGRYVAFLDTDNAWTPEFLERSVEFAAAHRAPWVHAALQIESKVAGTRYRTFEGSREQLLHGNYIDMNVLVAERAVLQGLGGFDESLRRAVDYDLILRLSEVSPPRLVPTIGAIYQDNSDDPDRISVAEPMAWNYFVSLKHLVDVDAQPERPTVPGRVSVIVPVRERPQQVVDLVSALLRPGGNDDVDVEVVLVVSGAAIHAARAFKVAAVGSPNVTVLYRPTEFGWAASIDLGASRASGEYLVAWRANCVPDGDWWTGLHDALQRPDVALAQALAVGSDGQVSSAGAVFVGNDPFPSPLLAGFPMDDAAPLVCATIPAALDSVVALRSTSFWAVSGVDAILANEFAEVDLSLRLRDKGLGGTVVTNTARVTCRPSDRAGFTPNPSASVRILRQRHSAPSGSARVWHDLQFEQTGRRVSALVAPPDTPVEQGAQPVVRPLIDVQPRRLRWALDVAADKNPVMWRVAQDLAVALRELGQQVHVDAGSVRNSPHRDFDDVTLVLRGSEDVRPRPGAVSLLWILTDPSTVTEPECAAHDRVFAASVPWARVSGARWGLRVDPLLQCVDPALFRPDTDAIARGAERDAHEASWPSTQSARPYLVFAGDSDGILRPSVKSALDAGVQPEVFGTRWQNLVPDEFIANVPTDDQLSALFGSASAVLWDHPVDLRHDGFISQRVFEVLACGGRLLCDDVVGLREQFGDAVRIFDSSHDVERLFAADWVSRWPGTDDRLAVAEQVRSEHSFAARAATLVGTALELTGVADRSGRD